MEVLRSGKKAHSSLYRASVTEDKVVLKSHKRQPECSSSDWASGLPEEILDSILNRVIQLSDYLRFAAVCKPWFSAAAHQKDRRRREPHKQVVPFLLIHSPNQSPEAREAEDDRRRLYSVTLKKVLNMELRVPYLRRCCGSSHGWLANVELEDMGISLLNPFSGKYLRFPPISGSWYQRMNPPLPYERQVLKVVLSSDPCSSPNDFVVLAIYSFKRVLAYIKPGQGQWTNVWRFTRFEDAIYHLGKFYVVDFHSRVLSIDVSESNPQVKEVTPSTPICLNKAYLVESSSGADLLLVQRFRKPNRLLNCLMTSSFKIFKLLGLGSNNGDNDQEIIEKVEITNLGDETLFLGDNYSLCVSASHFPGCQANCIYYADDCVDMNSPIPTCGPQDTGIYFLEKRTFARHYQMNTRKFKSLPIPAPMPPPIWIVPTMR